MLWQSTDTVLEVIWGGGAGGCHDLLWSFGKMGLVDAVIIQGELYWRAQSVVIWGGGTDGCWKASWSSGEVAPRVSWSSGKRS